MTLGSKSASVLVKAIVGPSCHRRPCFRRQIWMAGRTCQMYFRGTASHPNSTCCGLIDAFAHVVSSAVARGRSRHCHHRFGGHVRKAGYRRQVY